jgi:hypothetical protein
VCEKREKRELCVWVCGCVGEEEDAKGRRTQEGCYLVSSNKRVMASKLQSFEDILRLRSINGLSLDILHERAKPICDNTT